MIKPNKKGENMEADIHEQLIIIFKDVFDLGNGLKPEELAREDTDAWWDSFSHLRLVLELEKTFNINISDEQIAMLNSFKEVESLIVELSHN
jgi:acyl carrier protein